MDLSNIYKINLIKEEAIARWKNLYEHESLLSELQKASNYLLDSGKTYANYQRFYGNWLRRSARQKFDTTTIDTFFDKTGEEWPELFQLLAASDIEE